MPNEPNLVSDGFASLLGGVNAGQSPNTIGDDQVAMAVNATMRGGFVKPRPGWNRKTLRFVDADGVVDSTLQSNFETKYFQGAAFYESALAPCIIASVGGRIFRMRPAGPTGTAAFTIQDISIVGDLNASNLEQTWFAQADMYMPIQDGQSRPLIFNGADLRRASVNEVPVGTVMEYGMGRLWVASADQQSFVAGDIIGGPSGTQTNGFRDAVLKFTENLFIAEGGSFVVPMLAGTINAMRFVANLDTSLGQGPLQVFTDQVVFSINTPLDRPTWQDQEYPLQTLSVIGYGSKSQNSTVLVNGDIWYRAFDGIRSFQVARRDFGTWVNTPMSREIDNILRDDDQNLLRYSSAVLFDNRLLLTATPQRDMVHGTYHKGLIALDFNPISSMRGRANPAYDGLWTGLNILQILKGTINGIERCFAFCLSAEDKIELWELSRNDKFDSKDNAIVWQFDTRSFGFNRGGWNLLKLEGGDLWIDELNGTTTFSIDFRPDQYPLWIDWGSSFSKCATTDCVVMSTGACPAPAEPRQQYRPRIQLPVPTDECEAATSKPYRQGFEFQARLTITGYCRIKKLRLLARTQVEAMYNGCPQSDTCTTQTGCEDNPYTYTTLP